MSPRIFLTWFVVTIVTVVLAVVVGIGHETASFDLLKREPVFEALRENPDAAAKVEVKSRFGEFTLQRVSGGWVSPDRADYPVKESDVRRLVVGLSDMRFVERKTANPERFKRLEGDWSDWTWDSPLKELQTVGVRGRRFSRPVGIIGLVDFGKAQEVKAQNTK